MLLPQEKRLLDEVLEWKNVDEAILYLIKNYGKEFANAKLLLGTITDIVDTAIGKISEIASQQSQASYMLMLQREMEPDKSGTFFASMVPVCIARFPNGNSEGCCKAERDYFDLFLTLFRDKKQFSWERDETWANTFGYTSYLRLVERQLKGGKR